MAKRAEAFMDKNKKAGKPFFIQLSWNALHAPGNALKATLAKYQKLGPGKNAERAAITEDLDTGVGMVLKSVDELGLAGDTFVIYMADNGAGGGKAALSGGKGDLYEGGIRVPFIARGPGVKANSWCHARVVGYDLLPTFCEWAKVPASAMPKGLEGGSLAGLLSNGGRGEVKRPREEMVFHFPHYQGDSPHSAIYLGNLKLIRFYEDNKTVMFDLSRDLKEQTDISRNMPAEAARLAKKLDDYLASVKAQMPTPNPQYDPRKAAPQQQKKGKDKKAVKAA